MPTITPIDQYAGSINFTIPPEYEAIKERVYSEIPTGDRLANKNEIIREVGIAAGVKGMVYTDALEEERMPPGDVQKEIGLICHNDIWELGEKYKLSPQEMRQAWK
ncbi:hypothetical protein FRB94_009705 [Tulasnella sp. JGI-2019a]|nr:hypothetical protein FRB93_006861 [Tulasnella sp. JGI-2019a]KAG8994669.1 hypothetical protein FRB94_009705 [Tulasnella sp. JGI-2019a]